MSSVLPAAGFCPAMIFSIFMCFTLAFLICRLVACLGSSRQSCLACACVAVAVALAACAPRPQSESRLPLLCPTLALPAVTCQDPTYILLDSGGSVHMLSEDTIGVTARIIGEIPVEALEVSVANDQVMRIERYALVELWFPCEESDGKGFKTYKEIKVQFEAYLSPSSISILSTGTLQRLGFQVWHYENDAQLQLSFPSAGLRFFTELYANTSWVTTCSYIGIEETVGASVPSCSVQLESSSVGGLVGSSSVGDLVGSSSVGRVTVGRSVTSAFVPLEPAVCETSCSEGTTCAAASADLQVSWSAPSAWTRRLWCFTRGCGRGSFRGGCERGSFTRSCARGDGAEGILRMARGVRSGVQRDTAGPSANPGRRHDGGSAAFERRCQTIGTGRHQLGHSTTLRVERESPAAQPCSQLGGLEWGESFLDTGPAVEPEGLPEGLSIDSRACGDGGNRGKHHGEPCAGPSFSSRHSFNPTTGGGSSENFGRRGRSGPTKARLKAGSKLAGSPGGNGQGSAHDASQRPCSASHSSCTSCSTSHSAEEPASAYHPSEAAFSETPSVQCAGRDTFGVDGPRLCQQVHGRGQSPQQCRNLWTCRLHRQCRLPRQVRRRALRRLRGSNLILSAPPPFFQAPGMHAPFLMPHPAALHLHMMPTPAHLAHPTMVPYGPTGDSYELLGGKTFGLDGTAKAVELGGAKGCGAKGGGAQADHLYSANAGGPDGAEALDLSGCRSDDSAAKHSAAQQAEASTRVPLVLHSTGHAPSVSPAVRPAHAKPCPPPVTVKSSDEES